MVVLAPRLRMLDGLAHPPINMSGYFLAHMTAKSHLQTSPLTPQNYRNTGQLLKIPAEIYHSAGGRGNPSIFVNKEPIENFRTLGQPLLGEE